MIGGGQRILTSLAVAAFALAGCGEAQRPPEAAPARIPKRICDDAKKALDELSRSGSFEYSAVGEATIEEAVWLPMLGGHRDALVQALAYHAACGAPDPPAEMSVTIKNEGGRVLTQRMVETSVDPLKLLEQ